MNHHLSPVEVIFMERDYSDSDVQSDQDSDHIQELRDVSNFSEKEIRSLLKSFFEANLSETEVWSKKIKGLSRTTIYWVFKKLRETSTIIRKPGSKRKSKIQDDIFEKVKVTLKDDKHTNFRRDLAETWRTRNKSQ